jgi:hypothetical protein
MVKNMKINFQTSDENGFEPSSFDNNSTIDGEFQDVNDEMNPIEQQFIEEEEKSKKSSDDLENSNKDPKS